MSRSSSNLMPALLRIACRLTAPLLCLCFLPPCPAQPQDVKPSPLPAGPTSYTKKDFQQDLLKCCRTLTVEAYQQFGLKNPSWDDGVVKLLEAYCQSRAGQWNGESLRTLGEPLVKAGCNDPLVLYIVGQAVWEQGRPAEAEQLAVRAIEGFKKMPYSKTIAWDAQVTLAETARRLGQPSEGRAAEDLSLQWLAQAAAEAAQKAANHRLLWRWLDFRLNDDGRYRLREEAYAALQAQPGADAWLVDMVGGICFVKSGWKARGAGFADTVTDAAEKTFQENLSKARTCFTRAWRLHPEYPEAATAMIEVAMSSNDSAAGETRKWFDRAVAAQFDWTEAYSQYEWSLRPRWGGSVEQMMAFGEECLAAGRFDTEVPWQYLSILYAVTNEEHETEYWARLGVYEKATQVCEGYATALAQFPDRVRGWRSRNAAIAWRSRRYLEAKKIMRDLNPNIDKSYFEAFNVSMPWVWGQVMCMTCPEGDRVEYAEKLYQKGHDEAALEAFKPLADLLGAPESQVYLRGRMDSLTKEIDFAKGEWVALQPEAQFVGWQQRWGHWGICPDGAVLSETNSRNLLACLMRVGDAFEIAGNIELPANNLAMAGVAVGLDLSGTPYWSTLQLSAADHTVHWCDNLSDSAGVVVPAAKTYEVKVRVWEGRVTAYINGERCLSGGHLYTSVAA
ncbi:MAG: hypothetical protein ABFE07_13185, partial [Armatimonadia bacterium]